jgi:DNA polymerase-3 subunit epsilon
MRRNDSILELPIAQAEFAIVDVETTGLSPKENRLTEIAIFTIKNREVSDEFSTLINPLVTIPAFITDMTGIDNIMVADAPTAREIIPKVAEILYNKIFVAHNVEFDWGFVKESAKRERNIELSNHKLCTVRLTRKLIPHLPSKSLGPVTKYFGIVVPERHRASGDAYATAILLLRHLKTLERQYSIKTVRQLLSFQFGGPVR